MYTYPFRVRFPLFIPLLMLGFFIVNSYHMTLLVQGGYFARHQLLASLNVLVSVLAVVFLVLVYRRRAYLTLPVELSATHIRAVVMGKKTVFRLPGEYQAVSWGDIRVVRDFEKTSPQGRTLGEQPGIELVTDSGSVLVWSGIDGFDELKKTVWAKVQRSLTEIN